MVPNEHQDKFGAEEAKKRLEQGGTIVLLSGW